MTARALAREVGVSEASLSRWRSADSNIANPHWARLRPLLADYLPPPATAPLVPVLPAADAADLGTLVLVSELKRRHAMRRRRSMNQETEPASTTPLASAIRTGRKGLHLSQQRLAELAGVSTSAVRSWEAGRHSPRPDQLLRIADALRLPVREMAQYALDLTDLAGRPPDATDWVAVPVSRRIPVVNEKCAASHTPALESTADWLKRESTETEDVPGAQPGDFAIRISSAHHGSDFKPGSVAVLAAELKPQEGQMIGAVIAPDAGLVFGAYRREGQYAIIQADGREYRVDLAATPGAIVWAFPVRLVQRRYLT